MAEMDDDELLSALGIEVVPIKTTNLTPRAQRILTGFEDILRFHQTHGRAPQHSEGRDIFERLCAVRLDTLRKLPEALAMLAELDTASLLSGARARDVVDVNALDEDELLAELGVGDGAEQSPAKEDIKVLRHVRSAVEKRAAEEIANRTRCKNFQEFEPLFVKVRADLEAGIRKTLIPNTRALDEIQEETFFIIGGQIAYVASVGEPFTTKYERRDSRLRVIFDNGTESEVLQRSLQRSLHRDKVARLITEPSAGPLFGDIAEPDDIDSGTIYVLRSHSDNPYVAKHRELIHKIGVTGGKVETRIAGAELDSTYLLAAVEIVATYTLHNVNRTKLEKIFHRVLGAAQLDLTIEDRFGNPVKPKEWFIVPLNVIDEAVQRIVDGSITSVVYDPSSARLVRQDGASAPT